MIEDKLVALLSRALEVAAPGLGIDGDLPIPELLTPKQREHGDFATNVALGLAKRAGKPPRDARCVQEVAAESGDDIGKGAGRRGVPRVRRG